MTRGGPLGAALGDVGERYDREPGFKVGVHSYDSADIDTREREDQQRAQFRREEPHGPDEKPYFSRYTVHIAGRRMLLYADQRN